ncbi:MAG TPA: nucleotidyltransferase [Gemmatimonadaceae bacterium]|nr:nucleotidyltransferase [Gemmatimonadaceae bacterium]
MGQSTLDETAQDTNSFYRRTLHVLSDAGVPFLVGGSHAFLEYTGIVRNTKDFDLFLRRADMDRAMEALDAAGYRTELTFPHWLGKARQHDDHVDLVFNSGNGVCQVDDGWFDHAVETQVLGMPVKIVPVEELIWQKAFVMERERFDGADIMHIIRTSGSSLDWSRLLDRFGEQWPLLHTYLVFFHFVYPGELHAVPSPVLDELSRRLTALRDAPPSDRVCNGTLVSRAQYLLDIGQYGYADARLAPRGKMSPEDAIFWTWAITNVP